jgi:hypothetical protein
VRRDFTFLHPEVLDEKCAVHGNTLVLENAENRETYRVLIVPGSKTISASNLAKIREFYEAGGAVIATTRLPSKSAEFGGDEKVRQAVRAVFAADPLAPPAPAKNSNARGGKAVFVPRPTEEAIRQALDEVLPVYDVRLSDVPKLSGGNLSYIHKVRDGKNVYFFGNSSDTPVRPLVQLRDRLSLEAWDPHSGAVAPVDLSHGTDHGGKVTRIRLTLSAGQSVFLVEER